MIFAFGISLVIGLLCLAFIDARTFRLPNELSFTLIGVGLFFAHIREALTPALIGVAVGYLAFVTIEIAYRQLRRKDGLGRGDAKLLAVGGAWCGWAGLPFIILIASGSALVALLLPGIRNYAQSGRLPFGPFLALAIFIVWVSAQLAAV